jgi:hypothetical protein
LWEVKPSNAAALYERRIFVGEADLRTSASEGGRDFALRARAGCAGGNATVIDRRYIKKTYFAIASTAPAISTTAMTT